MKVYLLFTVACSWLVGAEALSINKGVIVHLFEWRFADIAKECEDFLAPYGFSGVQISPPSENIVIDNPKRPWWERYQPVSYKLISRSGSRQELQEMLDRCNRVGIRIFADVILNHMTGQWGRNVVGVGGSTADPTAYSYPTVPYTAADFHRPPCTVNNYNNATEVRNCELLGLRDLDNSKPNVRSKQLEYLNELINMGVAGFRIDAAKHMWPDDLKYIYNKLDSLSTAQGFAANTRPLIYQEVQDTGGEAVKYQEYAPLGMVTDFRYGNKLGETFLGKHDLTFLKNFGVSADLLPDNVGVVFVDNHDTQRGSNTNILNYKRFRPYKMALAFMLAYPWGTPLVLSSFYFDSYDQGPPQDNEYHTLSPRPIHDNICSNRWVCEHRWRQVYNMVRFHDVVDGTEVKNWWDNGQNQAAFCRGNKGFIAFNRETSFELDKTLQTCLPRGKYCDVISGNLVNNACTGKTIEVGEDGTARIGIRSFNMYDPDVENDGVLALHEEAKIVEEKKTPDNNKDKTNKKPQEGTTPEGDKHHSSGECHCSGDNGSSKPPGGNPSPSAGPAGGYSPSFSSGAGSDNGAANTFNENPIYGERPSGHNPSFHGGYGSGNEEANPSNGNPSCSGSSDVYITSSHGGHGSNNEGGNLCNGSPTCGGTPGGQSPQPLGGCGSSWDKLIKLISTGDGISDWSSLVGHRTDDISLMIAVARVRKMEKLLNLLSLV